MQKLLALDIGNTRIKAGVFDNEHLSFFQNFNSFEEIKGFADEKKIEKIIYSDVSGAIEGISNDTRFIPLSVEDGVPIKIDYRSTDTLGIDRIANVCGVFNLKQGCFLVIDAGSCITYDCLVNGTFIGGAITPGVQMRLNAMHQFTGKLPQWNFEIESSHFPFSGTQSNMVMGTWLGVLGEIERIITDFKAQYSQAEVVITGGNCMALCKALKSGIFADPNITLRGIFNIFKHQYA